MDFDTQPQGPERVVRGRVIGVRDLARLAGVDVSTVSRALNCDPRVSADRAELIRRLAKREGYRPRPLRGNRAQAIGVIIASSESDRIGGAGEHFLERIAWLSQQIVGAHRMHVNVECLRRGAESTQMPAIVQENRVDGVLIAGHPSVDVVRSIREAGVPVVAINDSCERLGVSCVRSEPGPAIREALMKLAAWGHRTFGLLLHQMDCPTLRARYDAYRESLQELYIDPDPAWLVTNLPGEIVGGREGVRALQRRGRLPTALICCDDWVALGALMELQAQGLRVPFDVSVVGHDDVSFCEALEPRLTSIGRPEHTMVSEGVRLLMEEIEQGCPRKPVEIRVEGRVIWRDSAGPSPDRLAQKVPCGQVAESDPSVRR